MISNNSSLHPPSLHKQLERTTCARYTLCGNCSAKGSEARPLIAHPMSRTSLIASALELIEDFPRPGLTYVDFTTLLRSPEAFQAAIDILAERYRATGITHIAACEARGFLIAAPLALALALPMLPIRKKHKLPGDVISQDVKHSTFSSEKLEMRAGILKEGDKVLIVDDVIGSGRTIEGVAALIGKDRPSWLSFANTTLCDAEDRQ
jgi:adenine phosphoribosyltransferase